MLTLSSLRTRWASFAGSFVAVALGVGVMTAMALGLAASLEAPERPPERFAASSVVVTGRDTLTMEVRRGPGTAEASEPLAHPQPVDNELLARLRALGPVRLDGGRRDAVGVTAPVAAVREAVREVTGDGARVLTGDARRLVDPATARDAEALVAVNALLGTAAGVAAFVSAFVTASTFAFVVALRRREFGLLRTAGATPGQVRRLLLGEAAAVGLTASAAGGALGSWAAPLLGRALVDGGVAPAWFAVQERPLGHWSCQLAFWTGVSVALAGAWTAAGRAGRTGPAEVLRDASADTGVMPRARWIAGGVLLACGLGLLGWTLVSDPSDLLGRKSYTTRPMVLVTAVAVLAPALVRPLVRLLRLPGAGGMLVRENAAASVRRTAAVAAPVLLTVGLAGSLLGAAGTVAAAKGAEVRERTRADLVVTDLPDGGAGARRAARAAGAAATGSAPTAVFVREDGTALVRSAARAVTDVAGFAAVTRLPVVAGDVRGLDDRSIVVNEEWARHEVGSVVPVVLGDGRRARLRVAAVLARGTGDNGAYVTMANARGAVVDRVDVRAPRAAGRAGRDRLAAALEASGGTVLPASEWVSSTRPRAGAQTRLGLFVVLGIALAYAAISLAGTLLMATSARSAELRSLRLAGATRGQVLRVVVGESVAAVCLGVLLGGAVAAVNLAGLGAALGRLSAPVAVAVPWEALGICAAACVAVGAAASAAGCLRQLGTGHGGVRTAASRLSTDG
ncbi:FtsX-like permease family protein [Streptomyces fructofermentans]|uniref:ABC transporter permease n=1 Tax=Streptomyces fructofermentans TaxID=152141 RepID=A0A918KIZ2_9ACTN|nr:ABC transporter permease [Streptomyces fructofermentans]GGX64950.1 ABC transporter permease [Streptomyces fructofermentans]